MKPPFPPPPPGRKGWPWDHDLPAPQAGPSGRASRPRITIVTPSLDQGEFLEETIRSVLLQGYPDLEYLVMDGMSTDRTEEILKRYGPWLKMWVREPDRGQSHAINKGWRLASGDIIAWINGDDVYLPDALETVADVFAGHPDAVVVCGAGQTRSPDLSRVLSTKPPSRMEPYEMIRACGHVPLQPSVFLRRRVLGEAGFLDEDLHYVMDWEYWIRLGLRYAQEAFVPVNRFLSVNREWPLTKTNTGFEEACAEHRRVIDSLVAARPGDAVLSGIKDAARRASYRKQAELALGKGLRGRALAGIARALSIRPLTLSPRREMILLIKALLPRSSRRAD